MTIDLNERRAGVVLHLTSLPGPHGSGDLGPDAHRFVDWLASAGQRLWQVLPVGPAGPGNSPYQSPSAFAGSPLLVALQPLAERGWLDAAALAHPPGPAAGSDGWRIDFGATLAWRAARLREAAAGFAARATPAERAAFGVWRAANAAWLEDWTLYAALKDAAGQRPWWDWEPALARREPEALRAARTRLAPKLDAQAFVQWCFDTQLAALRARAASRGVALMGDLPIFVAHDSADVWARRDLFRLDTAGQPTVVAGVPPDGYSPDGQRWGNPLYDWERMADDGFGWWVARVQRALALADVFRIDHFRGFAGCWEIPADCPSAREGRWVPAPGHALFEAVEARLGRLPIVAEDLGLITPDVVELRERFGFPGMRIVQEAFQRDGLHDFLPHRHVPRALAYTSTHDSDTALGWWRGTSEAQRAFAADYLGIAPDRDGTALPWALLRATQTSVAALALAPMQDLLALDGAHRMNLPGSGEGHWGWRFEWARVPPALAGRLRRLAEVAGRTASPPPG